MKTFGKVPLLALLPILAGLAMAPANPSRSPIADKEVKAVEVKKVPLGLIYSTSEQKGLRAFDKRPPSLDSLIERAVEVGASNILLARGDDIAAAVQATRRAFTRSISADEPVAPDQEAHADTFWLVAYFGVSGSGEAWLVRSVEVQGKRVRLTLRKGVSENNDDHPYFAWVPLGKLDSGTYSLELFDEHHDQATLVRKVRIPTK